MAERQSPARRLLLSLPPEATLLITALVVGIGGGTMAVVFRYLIRGVEWVGYSFVPQLLDGNIAYVILVPTLGGALVGFLVQRYAPEAKGHGVPEVMEAVALHGGRIRPVVVGIKALASSICIGSGGSVGREGPIVQIGSALGSTLAQWLRVSEDRAANLVACGAAAGIAATFNAPMAGVIFALEVILGGRFSVPYFSSVVISAVASSVIGRIAFGDIPAFRIPFEYGIGSLWEYLLCPVLGVIAALLSAAYVRILYASEDRFDAWTAVPAWIKPAVGGALLGALALLYPRVTPVSWEGVPQVFDVGYRIIEQALSNQMALGVLLSLLVLKLIATSLTLGSGGSGGIFAPSLFMGAMLGGAFQQAAVFLLPYPVGPAGAYALVGMAAFFGASAHAPITAVIILFELTGDYQIILPLMLTTVVATVISQRLLHGESIYTLKLSRRGTRLSRGRNVDVLEAVTVAEVMDHDVETVTLSTPISALGDMFDRYHRTALIVLDASSRLAGIVTVSDFERACAAEMPPDTPASAIGTFGGDLVVTHPDENVGDALVAMGGRGIGRVPVVARDDPGRLLGIVRRNDMIRGYQLASARRADMGERDRLESSTSGRAEFMSVVLPRQTPVAGKTLAALAKSLPHDAVVVAVERGDTVVIPHGDTVLQPGDRLTAFVRRQDSVQLLRALQG